MTFEEQVSKRLQQLNDTQASIETLSQWLIFHRKNADISVEQWAQATREAATPKNKLNLIYLANDVLQNARKKGDEFAKAFSNVLAQVIPQIYQDCSVDPTLAQKILRVLDIWIDRQVFSQPDFISNIKSGLLSISNPQQETSATKQPASLISDGGVKKKTPPKSNNTTPPSTTVPAMMTPALRELSRLLEVVSRNSTVIKQQKQKQQANIRPPINFAAHFQCRRDIIGILRDMLQEQERELAIEQQQFGFSSSSTNTSTTADPRLIKRPRESDNNDMMTINNNNDLSGNNNTGQQQILNDLSILNRLVTPFQMNHSNANNSQPVPTNSSDNNSQLENILKIFSASAQNKQ